MSRLLFRWFAIALSLSLLATACGGESDAEDGADPETETTEPDDTTDPDPEPEDTTNPEPEPDEDPAGEPVIYDDPRGGIFAEFQESYDRAGDPFAPYDALCLPHDAAEDRVDTDPGITADEIRVGHIRSRLEDAVDIGFGVPVGDPKEMFEVFVDYINTECGGIRGRQINLGYAEADLLGDAVEASRNQACLAMTEDFNATIIMNSTGFQGSANLCIVEEQQTAFISTQGQTEEFMARGEDRLISLSPTLEESLRFLVADLVDSGVLEGHSLGVAAPNTPGQYEAVEQGLVQPLLDAGFEIVIDELDCAGGTVCSGGVPESVQNMVDADVDVFFNVMNILTAPGYLNEMVSRGFQPGDVQFYASDFNSQAAELVSGQIANNPEAGNLYNGAIVVDFRDTGVERTPDYEPNPFAAECNRVYSENSPSGASHAWDDPGDSAFGMVGSVCGIVRIMARAIYAAGDNPTIADIQASIASLGPIDNNAMNPASIVPGKTQSSDVIQTLDWVFPCDLTFPFTRSSGDPICLTGRGDWRPSPR
ncbi:MAG: ABC transporter substrate-binding protein [Acidimicrobiales bacterium]